MSKATKTAKAERIPPDSDRYYVEFVMGPLREKWRLDGPKRPPRSLDEAAEHSGEKSFNHYRVMRNRQYLIHQLDNVLAKTQAGRKDAASGQECLF